MIILQQPKTQFLLHSPKHWGFKGFPSDRKHTVSQYYWVNTQLQQTHANVQVRCLSWWCESAGLSLKHQAPVILTCGSTCFVHSAETTVLPGQKHVSQHLTVFLCCCCCCCFTSTLTESVGKSGVWGAALKAAVGGEEECSVFTLQTDHTKTNIAC